MRLAVTGFVSAQAGSVASANALLLRGLLERGCEIVFFSKASFVDPRPAIGNHPRFQFVEVDNVLADRFRTSVQRVPLLGQISSLADSRSYNRLLVRRMNEAHARQHFDLSLWLGEYAHGPVADIPTVSFIQGAPGTDARSIASHFEEIKRLAGFLTAWKWRVMAALRLSKLGLPPFQFTDRFIVGSTQSSRSLTRIFSIPAENISTTPYPIDLKLFQLGETEASSALRCLWLGRIIPRKRLDLFLDGAAEAIRRGLDVRPTVVGGMGFVRGYEKLIERFPYPDRLNWVRSVPREKVPALIRAQDVLVQPSEEEDFGSSSAEAQACGLPVIVGATSGNADYLCARDIHLRDYRPETLADALEEMARRKPGNSQESREHAEKIYAPERVTDRFFKILSTSL